MLCQVRFEECDNFDIYCYNHKYAQATVLKHTNYSEYHANFKVCGNLEEKTKKRASEGIILFIKCTCKWKAILA